RLPASDPEALEERITRRALDAVGERLERQQDPRELIDEAVPRVVDEAAARSLEAARELIDQGRAGDEAARSEAKADLAALAARVEALAASAGRASADDVAG